MSGSLQERISVGSGSVGDSGRKRTRQACEPCRRKKSKCTGDRPICATCRRLRHPCEYGVVPSSGVWESQSPLDKDHGCDNATGRDPGLPPDPSSSSSSSSHWQRRFEALESTLARLVSSMNSDDQRSVGPSLPVPNQEPSPFPPGTATASPSTAETISPGRRAHPPPASPHHPPPPRRIQSWAAAVALADLYMVYCDSQPLPLFGPEDYFVATFPNRPLEVVYAVLAAAWRHADKLAKPLDPGAVPDAETCRDEATALAMASVVRSRCVELSTLQALSLLALDSLHAGDVVQYRTHAYLAMSLLRSARLDRACMAAAPPDHGGTAQEPLRCYWSVVLLHRLMGEPCLAAFGAEPSFQLPAPQLPSSPTHPASGGSTGGCTPGGGPLAEHRDGIVSVVIRLSRVWHMAQDYVSLCGAMAIGTSSMTTAAAATMPSTTMASELVPWHPRSMYSKIQTAVMQTSQDLSPVHRYQSMRFSAVTSDDLQVSRAYWGPWMLSRLMYHTVLCILNHPVLIMLQVQSERLVRAPGGQALVVPEIFVQQTVSARLHHAAWLRHFFSELLESKDFYVTDPVFAYCAAVLATMELHQSFLAEGGGRSAAAARPEGGYDLCLQFLDHLSARWPWLSDVVSDIEHLRAATLDSFRCNTRATQDESQVNVDISGFLQLLHLSEFFSGGRAARTASLLGPTLSSRLPIPSLPHSTDLTRLPAITRISPNDRDGADETGGDYHGSRDQLPSLACPGEGEAQYHSELLLPADQFFGGIYDMATPWDAAGGMSLGL